MTYEYVCTHCGHAWEAEQAISAAPLKSCPSCGTDHAKRQISRGAGFILKGGGWYADGYGSSKASSGGSSSSISNGSSEGPSAASTSGAGKTDASKTETKSETKPETKPEAPKTTGTSST